MLKRITASVCVAAAMVPALVLGGCTDKNKTKLELQAVLTKQSEMKTYAFAGDADLELGTVPPAKDANSITASLISMFLNGKLEWNGKSSADPLRLEATLKSSPAAAPAPLELPLLIKDNKMYLSFPLINKKDEYFVIDMNPNSQAAKPLLTAEGLKSVTGLTGNLASTLLSELDGKWVKKTNEGYTLPDGKKGPLYTINITDNNKKDVSGILQKQWPSLIETLQSKGMLTAEQSDKLKQKTLTVTAPGQLVFAAGPDGFIREETIKLAFTESDPAGTTANRHLNVHQTFDQVNANIAFEKEAPQSTKPFDEVLRLLGNPKK